MMKVKRFTAEARRTPAEKNNKQLGFSAQPLRLRASAVKFFIYAS
jgi:hypothetical protein